MPVYYDKDKERWRFTFNRIIAAQRTRATKLLPKGWSRTQAEKYDREETARLYAVASGVEKPEPTIGDAVTLYIEYRLPKLRTGKRIAQELAHLFSYIEGKPMSKVAEVAREYMKENADLMEGTHHNRLAYLKAACRYAWKKHKLTELDPTGQMDVPKPDNRRHVHIPVEKVRELLKAIEDEETRALFTLAFRVGSRWVKGVHPRQPEDVHRVGRDVWLHVGKTKNGSPRMKWVHPDAHWTLKHIPFQYTPEHYYRKFCDARVRVGLPGFWAHDMRHVIGTDIRKRGGSLEDVGAALDHDSYQSSERYSHIVPAQIKRVLAGVGSGGKMHTRRSKKTRKKAA